MTQDKLKHLLAEEMKRPIQRGKPLELSTEASTPPSSGKSAQTHHRTIAPSGQYKRVNRGYKLREDLIKACKLRALEQDKMLYEVMEEALIAYLEDAATPESRAAGDIEERYRTDTQVHHFKKWLRSHDQPEDSTFAQRFLVDGQLPEHASRGMYEAKLRKVTSGYSEEDMHLFQEAWKAMLFSEQR